MILVAIAVSAVDVKSNKVEVAGPNITRPSVLIMPAGERES